MILQYTENADEMILASFLARFASRDYNKAFEAVKRMKPGEKENLFKELFRRMEFFDAPPREFKEIIHETNRVYLQLREKYGAAADYILTNSHCRPVIVKMNLREFYHFIRLRSDEHTQWDIRGMSHQLIRKVKEIMPYSTMLLCGKSDFAAEFEKIYNLPDKTTAYYRFSSL